MEYLKEALDTGQHEDRLYRFKSIKDHRGPYSSADPEDIRSSHNLLIEWETGEMTWDPISNVIADDPYSCAVYAKKFNVLTQGWKQLMRYARAANKQAKATKSYKY